jgi:hypothetical protein
MAKGNTIDEPPRPYGTPLNLEGLELAQTFTKITAAEEQARSSS